MWLVFSPFVERVQLRHFGVVIPASPQAILVIRDRYVAIAGGWSGRVTCGGWAMDAEAGEQSPVQPACHERGAQVVDKTRRRDTTGAMTASVWSWGKSRCREERPKGSGARRPAHSIKQRVPGPPAMHAAAVTRYWERPHSTAVSAATPSWTQKARPGPGALGGHGGPWCSFRSTPHDGHMWPWPPAGRDRLPAQARGAERRRARRAPTDVAGRRSGRCRARGTSRATNTAGIPWCVHPHLWTKARKLPTCSAKPQHMEGRRGASGCGLGDERSALLMPWGDSVSDEGPREDGFADCVHIPSTEVHGVNPPSSTTLCGSAVTATWEPAPTRMRVAASRPGPR